MIRTAQPTIRSVTETITTSETKRAELAIVAFVGHHAEPEAIDALQAAGCGPRAANAARKR